METLTVLGSALGLAALSGINLYATVAIVGLAIQLGWVNLPSELGGLDILASWWIVGLASGMYLVEFVADKWPWLNNVWDLAHTFIRPPAAALVGLAATSQSSDPIIQVGAALLAGGVALGTHAAKSTTRLTMNATSAGEPTSNIAMSLAEDVAVASLVLFVVTHPVISLAVLTLLAILAVWLTPKIFRLIGIQARGMGHFARYLWHRLQPVPWELPPRKYLGTIDPDSIILTIPCASLKLRKVGRHRHGYLVLTDRRELVFLTRRWWRTVERHWTNVEIESVDVRLGRIFRTLTLHAIPGKVTFKLYRNAPSYLESLAGDINRELRVPVRVKRPGAGRVVSFASRVRRSVTSFEQPAFGTY